EAPCNPCVSGATNPETECGAGASGMESGRSVRRPRRAREASSLGISLAGRPPLRNAFKPIEVLSEDQLEAIRDASLRLLEEIGIEFMGSAARRLFREAGAEVNDQSGLVRIPRGLVDEALRSAPARFTLTPRNPERRIHVGEDHISFGLVAG